MIEGNRTQKKVRWGRIEKDEARAKIEQIQIDLMKQFS